MNKENQINYFKKLSHGAESKVFELAKSRRQNQTPAEKILWECLRNKKLGGFKFRRQHPILNYIADFYCPSKMIVIEIDGKYHDELEQIENDKNRADALNDKEIKVLRFKNNDVMKNLQNVLKIILEVLNK